MMPLRYHSFNSWRKDGTRSRMNAVLREQLRQQQGQEASPSAGSIDSQSVKTTEKGAHAAMMEARKSKDASAMGSWIQKAWCSKP